MKSGDYSNDIKSDIKKYNHLKLQIALKMERTRNSFILAKLTLFCGLGTTYPILKISSLFIILVMSIFSAKAQDNTVRKENNPNILFIVVDDLRPELGCYGKPQIKSPNIDRLAKTGVVFKNAYCNYPVCGPSRASLLSGIYPSQKRFIGWDCSQDEAVPGIVSLPMHFKNNGYLTISLGKIYNNFGDGKGSWDKEWRPPTTTTQFWDYQSSESIRIHEARSVEWAKDTSIHNFDNLPHKRGPAFEKPDVPDLAYMDGRIANRALEELQDLKSSSKPFFLAVGFHKPHLPFNAPQKYWDMYNEKDILLPSNRFFPKDAPDAARSNWGELRGYDGIPREGLLNTNTALKLIHGYYACVSYVDAQIGLILNELENLGLASNTIVVLLGDNGWFLGEHNLWCKSTNFENAFHVPLIIKVPWKVHGLKTEALVDFLDIYPTLCKLANLSLPVHVQGKSFVPLLNAPNQQWEDTIFCRSEGETIITKTHAYTEWINYSTGKVYSRMLYDHENDPEENINIAEVSKNRRLIEELQKALHNHLKERDKITIP